jgi:hypothetical protein
VREVFEAATRAALTKPGRIQGRKNNGKRRGCSIL